MSEETTQKPMNNMFAITGETRSESYVPLLTAKKVENNPQFPNGWEFPITRLVNVIFNPAQETKNGTQPVLDFIFKDDKNRQYTHREWDIEMGDDKFAEKLQGMQIRIKHIFIQTIGQGVFDSLGGLGAGAQNMAQFFELVAKAFNSQTTTKDEKVHKVYYLNPCYTKVTYYKNKLKFPLSPNFLEKVIQNQPCTTLLISGSELDKLEPKKQAAGGGIPGVGTSSLGGGAPSGDLPAFGTGNGNPFV